MVQPISAGVLEQPRAPSLTRPQQLLLKNAVHQISASDPEQLPVTLYGPEQPVSQTARNDRAPPPPEPNPFRVSYASSLTQNIMRSADVPAHNFTALKPSIVDDKPCPILSPQFHQRQTKKFEHALHGRLLLHKGDSPRFAHDLHKELGILWKTNDPWHIVPLGKGYFTMRFSSALDFAVANGKPSWRLLSGMLRLQAWVPLFDPYKATAILAQVWIRIFHLPYEFWHPEVISGIALHVGAPIKIDAQSANAFVGHFARVLIEMDITAEVPDYIDVKCGDRSFEVEFGYENLPYYCHSCHIIGHTTNDCRKSSSVENNSPPIPDTNLDGEFKKVKARNKNNPGWHRVEHTPSTDPNRSVNKAAEQTPSHTDPNRNGNSFDALVVLGKEADAVTAAEPGLDQTAEPQAQGSEADGKIDYLSADIF
ncbi:uncharacterized protein LOC131019014 [Salvia miltiorrhiza]|uniref:uncharacterized protein LOC131019014 n=1 Tax=Salvia miltiorrhiza TaxID=226208 RepID=UPI0025ACDF39|nr:uncharacterized protein LOC131019014 [Salvia miltiorrhiza]